MRCEDECGSVEGGIGEDIYEERKGSPLHNPCIIIQEMDRMCGRRAAKTGEFLEKLSMLKDYTEGLSDKLNFLMMAKLLCVELCVEWIMVEKEKMKNEKINKEKINK